MMQKKKKLMQNRRQKHPNDMDLLCICSTKKTSAAYQQSIINTFQIDKKDQYFHAK
jgi:hypothetical protein